MRFALQFVRADVDPPPPDSRIVHKVKQGNASVRQVVHASIHEGRILRRRRIVPVRRIGERRRVDKNARFVDSRVAVRRAVNERSSGVVRDLLVNLRCYVDVAGARIWIKIGVLPSTTSVNVAEDDSVYHPRVVACNDKPAAPATFRRHREAPLPLSNL